MKNFYAGLRVVLSVLLLTLTSFAFSRKCSVCIVNVYGEQSFLYLDEYKPGRWNVTGTHDYSVFGGTVWPVVGTYSCITKKLHYTATNPTPDNCALWANNVTFDYDVSDTALIGNFTNDCGLGKAFSAVASMGGCKIVPQNTMKGGDFGTTGSHKINRTLQNKLPKGDKLNELLKDKSINISITPNPAKQFAKITFNLESATKAQVRVYDMQGNHVHTFAETTLTAGEHTYNWNLISSKGVAIKNGYYWIRIITDKGVSSKQLFIEK